jgi:GH15 family glucan-1,4-alpha-glucosidase
VFNELGRRPREGDEVEAGGAHLRVEQLDGHRITRLQSRRTCDDESSSPSEAPVHEERPGEQRPDGHRQAERARTTTAPSAVAPSPFTPIADYGFLSNCHTGALVAPDGTVDWLCVPRFDSPSVFGALLDRGAGGFRFGPFGVNVPMDRIYEPGTNTLVTSWKTPTGWVVVRDALTMGPRAARTRSPRTRGRRSTRTPTTRSCERPPASRARWRSTSCASQAFDYGRVPGEWTVSADRQRAEAIGAGQALVMQSDMLLGIEAGRARARRVLQAGETVYCALAWGEDALVPGSAEEASAQLEATTMFWRDWLARAAIPDHPLGPLIQRAALTIKGLTYMPTGASVAALTTSLPETPGGERNWDYRYTWIRDSTFLLRALHYLLLDWEADEFMQFIADLDLNDDGACRSCTASTAGAT